MSSQRPIGRSAIMLALLVSLLACQVIRPALEQTSAVPDDPRAVPSGKSRQLAAQAVRAVDLKGLPTLKDIMPHLAQKQVVFVGETHDRFGHHLAQLDIIRGLHAIHNDLVIGVEFFQVPFQSVLDVYIAGQLTEKALVKQTEYYERWRFDYRLYRPIVQYARERGIRLIALNIPSEISRKVARSGIESLSATERAQIPQEIDRSDMAYRERLRSVFEAHSERGITPGGFERFVDAQLLWDEGMAETAATFLRTHPGRHMVILAGSGHLFYGAGIPRRLLRRVTLESAIVIHADEGVTDPLMADFLLFAPQMQLPPAGVLGVFLQERDGRVAIAEVAAEGAAQHAGLQKGDLLLVIDGVKMSSVADVKIALLDKKPGERMRVNAKRELPGGTTRAIDVDIELQASH